MRLDGAEAQKHPIGNFLIRHAFGHIVGNFPFTLTQGVENALVLLLGNTGTGTGDQLGNNFGGEPDLSCRDGFHCLFEILLAHMAVAVASDSFLEEDK